MASRSLPPVTPSWHEKYRKWLIVGALAGTLFWFVQASKPLSYPPGQLIVREPQQTELTKVRGSIARDGYALTPLYEFSLKARVLGTERYRFDNNASISPYDLALGWGVMSDESYLERVTISQSGRFYYYSWGPGAGVSKNAIATSSSNMHMIPATDEIEDEIGDAREGDIVRLVGYLAHVTTPEGYTWRSSTTRNDQGNGACEIVYVEEFEIITDDYAPL